MSEEQIKSPKGYQIVRRGLFQWGWIDPSGYASLFDRLTAKGAIIYAMGHAKLMEENRNAPSTLGYCH